MAEEWNLPGVPKKGLVRKVKSVLFKWLRCRPHINDKNWKLAWKWATSVAYDNMYWENLIRKKKLKSSKKWPSPEEIACQYLFIVLTEMRTMYSLRLPSRASEHVPKELADNLQQIAKSRSMTGMQLGMSKFKVEKELPRLTIEEILQLDYEDVPDQSQIGQLKGTT